MILKRNFNPIKVLPYVKAEMIFALIISIFVYALHGHGLLPFSVPFSIVGILASALAIFIAFRNNSSYGRWWEARTAWGGIVNASRVLGRLVITFADSHAHQPNYDLLRSNGFKQALVLKLIAWPHALRFHLRKEDRWNELKVYLDDAEYSGLLEANNKPNYLHLITGQQIYKAMADGTLGGFDSFQMEAQLLALANHQGSCERIKHTPLLRQYHYFTKIFLFTFICILPFSLAADFAKAGVAYLLIPVSLIVSFVFAIIGKVGEVNEDPFENRITDVPLTSLCTTIERDLKEMLGYMPLPEALQPKDGYVY